jgi:hypothetical protein
MYTKGKIKMDSCIYTKPCNLMGECYHVNGDWRHVSIEEGNNVGFTQNSMYNCGFLTYTI